MNKILLWAFIIGINYFSLPIKLYSDYTLELLNKEYSKHANYINDAIVSVTSKKDNFGLQFESLLGGLSKASLFKFEYLGKSYVLRLLDPSKELDRRKSEVNAHKLAASLGIAPKILYVDAVPLVMLMEFIDGRVFTLSDLKNKPVLAKVIVNLKKIHQYSGSIDLVKVSKLNRVKNLIEKYEKRKIPFPSCYGELYKNLLEDASNFQLSNASLCHGDFNTNNILIDKSGDPYFIDFAEASFDSPFLDLGWLSFLSGSNFEETKLLLTEYLGRKPNLSELKETLFFKELTAFLLGTIWIPRQEERNQKILDEILNEKIKRGSDYIREGVTTVDVSHKNGRNLTIYTLGFFKDFIEISKSIRELKN